jgi:hypothetical protein
LFNITFRMAACFAVLSVGPGCSSSPLPFVSDMGLPSLYVPHVLRMVDNQDHPGNLIERSLSQCSKRVAAGEAACVKDGLLASGTDVASLAKMVPGCRRGIVCHYEYVTDDKVGLVPATESHFTVHWRVDFDLKQAKDKLDSVPISAAII